MSSVEERLAKIEREIEMLKKSKDSPKKKDNWISSIVGTFKGDSDFKEIVRMGKEQRDAEQPPESE